MRTFSFKRFAALLRKEWLQILRDPITLRFIIALPMMQLFLFGYAINTDPKHLPAGLLSVNHSKYERSLIAALQNTGYYDISMLSTEAEAERALAQGELLFVITIPANFDRSVDRGDAPSVLIDADASDPTAVANATAALPALSTALNRDLPPIRQVQSPPLPFQIVVHARYNPERLTVLNVVPGLICIVLIFSTVFVTVSLYATCGLPTLAATLNSRSKRSTMISKWSSPMPEMIVCPVSSSVNMRKVGSSSASFCSDWPSFS